MLMFMSSSFWLGLDSSTQSLCIDSPALEGRLMEIFDALLLGNTFPHQISQLCRGHRAPCAHFTTRAEVISHIQQGYCKDKYI